MLRQPQGGIGLEHGGGGILRALQKGDVLRQVGQLEIGQADIRWKFSICNEWTFIPVWDVWAVDAIHKTLAYRKTIW